MSTIASVHWGTLLGGVRGVYDRHEFKAEKTRVFEALAAQVGRILNGQPATANGSGADLRPSHKSSGRTCRTPLLIGLVVEVMLAFSRTPSVLGQNSYLSFRSPRRMRRPKNFPHCSHWPVGTRDIRCPAWQ